MMAEVTPVAVTGGDVKKSENIFHIFVLRVTNKNTFFGRLKVRWDTNEQIWKQAWAHDKLRWLVGNFANMQE